MGMQAHNEHSCGAQEPRFRVWMSHAHATAQRATALLCSCRMVAHGKKLSKGKLMGISLQEIW